MFQSITRKNKWIIHLIEYNLCKIQYVRKSKGSFKFRLNCRRKDDEHTNLERQKNISLYQATISILMRNLFLLNNK